MAFKINKDISKASTIPKEFYLDHHYFNLCLNTLFPNSWQFIFNKEKLQNSNIYPLTYLKDSLEEPVVLIKHKNEIKCLEFLLPQSIIGIVVHQIGEYKQDVGSEF